jgi:hypothetical protein
VDRRASKVAVSTEAEAEVSLDLDLALGKDENRSSGRASGRSLRDGAAGAPVRSRCVAQSRRPALADIIGARRMWTVAMISSGSMPWR